MHCSAIQCNTTQGRSVQTRRTHHIFGTRECIYNLEIGKYRGHSIYYINNLVIFDFPHLPISHLRMCGSTQCAQSPPLTAIEVKFSIFAGFPFSSGNHLLPLAPSPPPPPPPPLPSSLRKEESTLDKKSILFFAEKGK